MTAGVFDGTELVFVDADVDIAPATAVPTAVVDPVVVDVVGADEFDGSDGGGG